MNFEQYRRTQKTEMALWSPESEFKTLQDLQDAEVFVSQADIDNGSPETGDHIARNSQNHKDMWLVAKDYFEANFTKL